VVNLALLLISYGHKPIEAAIIPFCKAQMLLIQDLIQKCSTKFQEEMSYFDPLAFSLNINDVQCFNSFQDE
jgi:hypothetical protein